MEKILLYDEIHKIVLKTAGLRDVLLEALNVDQIKFAFVFGSIANGNANSESDIEMKTAHSPQLKDFIHEHRDLFWYTPEGKKEEISLELLLETILNYGSLKDSLQLIKMIGTEKTLRILQGAKGRKKMNYYPEIYNFFTLYLRRNA